MKAAEPAAKGLIAALMTVIAYFSKNITPLFWLLIFFEIADYISGMTVGKFFPTEANPGWDSKKAMKGFIKKIGYLFLIAVAFGLDFVITEMSLVENFPVHLEWGMPYFGMFSVIYLILTEGVSIVENLASMGIEIPFLTNGLKTFREKIQNQNPKK